MARNLDVEFPVYEDSRPMAGERGPGQGWGDWLDEEDNASQYDRAGKHWSSTTRSPGFGRTR